jgi:hypothetical protein
MDTSVPDYRNCVLSIAIVSATKKLRALVERVSGERLLSDQKIGQIVSAKALALSQETHRGVAATLSQINTPDVRVNPKVDIYDPEEQEILLFDDGIEVKSQKSKRQPKDKQELVKKGQDALQLKTPAVHTDS